MDPVNERRVFDLIVAATSSHGADSSQYFILTPKVRVCAAQLHDVLNGV